MQRAPEASLDAVNWDRIWSRIDAPRGMDGCWIWTGYITNAGYGQVGVQGHARLVHRLVYRLIVGPIPPGLVCDHLCRTPACCNPAHIEPVTQSVNVRRGEMGSRTHCPQGHAYDEVNTYLNPRGQRICRECNRASVRASYARRKAGLR